MSLVTAGGTREPIDSVRFIGNRSSGRMGFALADEARRRGARVTLLAANVALLAPRRRRGRPDADGVRSRARGARPGRRRRHRDGGRRRRLPRGGDREREARQGRSAGLLELTPTVDVATRSARRAGRNRCSSRSGPSTASPVSSGNARCCPRRILDLVVYNDVGRTDIGFDSAYNEVTLFQRRPATARPAAPKPVIAAAFLDEIERLLGER